MVRGGMVSARAYDRVHLESRRIPATKTKAWNGLRGLHFTAMTTTMRSRGRIAFIADLGAATA